MKQRTAVCPSCGGPVEFQVGSSLVTICEFCNSAVARTDKKIEDLGKVADLAQTESRLRCGLTGRFNKKRFTIVGRVQYSHPAGGVWDEWYLAFPGDRWGWLSEAQGSHFLMFQRTLSRTLRVPSYGKLKPGTNVMLGKSAFTVSEKGVATASAAEGDIPWAFRPGAEHQYVDLSGPDDTFATFEYGEINHAYVGKEISLDDLELSGVGWQEPEASISVPALQLNCPHCGGPLTLRVPDKSERVTCPSCNSMLDVDDGKLKYLASLKKIKSMPILIPLGSQGTLFDRQYTVIGFMRRFSLYEGKTYPWSEYLLHNDDVGFRWLINNDRHWSFAEPVSVHASQYATYRVRYDNDEFKVYDRGTAYVRDVMGEFYWRVEAGETVRTADFIAPPRMLSFEWTKTEKSEELNVSLSTYIAASSVEKAFGVKQLMRPWGVGPIQPRPQVGAGVFVLWFVFMALLVLIQVGFSSATVRTTGADPWLMFYGMIAVSLIPAGILGFMYSFEVKRWEDSDYSPYASSE